MQLHNNYLQSQDYNLNLNSYNSMNPSAFFTENASQNDLKPKYHPMNNTNEMNLINYGNDNDINNKINNKGDDDDEDSNDNKKINNIDNNKNKNINKNEEEKEEGYDPDNELFKEKVQENIKKNEDEEDELSSISKKSNESNDEKYFTNHLLSQYEKVRRVKDKWKLNLKGCIVQNDQNEYVCGKLHGELNRDW